MKIEEPKNHITEARKKNIRYHNQSQDPISDDHKKVFPINPKSA